MQKRDLNRLAALLQGTYYPINCVSLAFFVPVFQTFGFSKFQIGMIMMLGYISTTLMQPVWGFLCDKFSSPKRLVLTASSVSVAMYFLLIFSDGAAVPVCIAVIGAYATLQPMGSIIDSWLSKLMLEGYQLNYGVTRSSGSLTYAIVAFFYGFVLDRFGIRISPFIMLALYLLFISIVLRMPNPEAAPLRVKISLTGGVRYLAAQKAYLVFLAAYFLTYIANAAIGTFLSVLVMEKGGTQAHVGMLLFVGAMVEMPTMLLFHKFRRRFPIRTEYLLIISMFFYGIKSLLLGLAPSLAFIFIANITQALAYALFLPASIYYLMETIDKKYLSTAQLFCSAIGASLCAIIFNPVCGALAERMGTQPMLRFVSIFAFAGAALMSVTLFIRRDTAVEAS